MPAAHTSGPTIFHAGSDGAYSLSGIYQDGATYNLIVHIGLHHYKFSFTAPTSDAVTGGAVSQVLQTSYHKVFAN